MTEMKMMKRYNIIFGNRRFMACKNLGMKKILAMVEGKMIEVPISLITCQSNSRSDLGDLTSLMLSIKDNGLLQPIGLTRKKQDRKFVIDNAVENLQRKDINVTEIGKICKDLHERYKMTNAEIAIRLGISRSNVTAYMNAINMVPKELQKNIGYFTMSRDKKRKITPSIINAVAGRRRMSKNKADKIFACVAKKGFNVEQTRKLAEMVRSGVDVEKAEKKIDHIYIVKVELTVNKKIYDRLKNKDGGVMKMLSKALKKSPDIPKGLII